MRNVTAKNVHVDIIADSIRSIVHATNVVFENVTYDEVNPTILPHLDRYLGNR